MGPISLGIRLPAVSKQGILSLSVTEPYPSMDDATVSQTTSAVFGRLRMMPPATRYYVVRVSLSILNRGSNSHLTLSKPSGDISKTDPPRQCLS